MNLKTIASCPRSPNCVSTQAQDAAHRIDPFTFAEDPSKAMARLVSMIKSLPRTKIVQQTATYLHVEFTSAIMRYVDDVEFVLVADNKTIHFRSKSRVGYSDLGTNRRRMESLRQIFKS